MSGVSLISEEMRARMSRNYVQSEREARFASFHFMAFLLVGLIAFGALARVFRRVQVDAGPLRNRCGPHPL
jgi:hypothetical protein